MSIDPTMIGLIVEASRQAESTDAPIDTDAVRMIAATSPNYDDRSTMRACADEIDRLRADLALSEIATRQARETLAQCEGALAERDATIASLRADVAEARALAERYLCERGRAQSDVAAMLPIVEAARDARFTDAALAARRFLDARKVGP